jgi:hypothetical protein
MLNGTYSGSDFCVGNRNGGAFIADKLAAIAPAQLVARGTLSFPECFSDGTCDYQGEATNEGTGCASGVRGITRLFDSAEVEKARDEWTRSGTVRPGDAFLYEGCCFDVDEIDASSLYRTEIFWTNVRC